MPRRCFVTLSLGSPYCNKFAARSSRHTHDRLSPHSLARAASTASLSLCCSSSVHGKEQAKGVLKTIP